MKKIIIIFIFFTCAYTNAQDAVFSQAFLVPETLSASFTGAIKGTKLGALYKTQGTGSVSEVNSNFAFLDTWFEIYNIGLGVSILNQTNGGSTYTFNQVNLNCSLAFQINNVWYFRPSVSAGFGMKSFGVQNFLLGDQINIGDSPNNPTSVDPILLGSKRAFIDLSPSLLIHNEYSWIGITVRHLNKPNVSITQEGTDYLNMFWSIHAKYYIPFLENFRNSFASKSKMYLLSNYMKQGDFNRLDMGTQYSYDDRFSLGITAGIIPNKNDANTSLMNSISTFISFQSRGFKFGYSYEYNSTDLINTINTHELSISYDFKINSRRLYRLKTFY